MKDKPFSIQIMLNERVRVYKYPDRKDIYAEGEIKRYKYQHGILHFEVLADVLVFPDHVKRLDRQISIVRIANGYTMTSGKLTSYVEPVDPAGAWARWHDTRMRTTITYDGEKILAPWAMLMQKGDGFAWEEDGYVHTKGSVADYLSLFYSKEYNDAEAQDVSTQPIDGPRQAEGILEFLRPFD